MQDDIQGELRSDDVFGRKESFHARWILIGLVVLISAVLSVGVLLFQHDLQAKLSGIYRSSASVIEPSAVTTGRSLDGSRPVTSPPVPKPPVVAPSGECPPGQVAGIFESERTGRRVICHEPSFAESPPPSVVSHKPAPALTEQVRRRMQQAPVQQVPAQPSTAELCARLTERVSYLDSMARQPQSGPTQDWIRGERQKARDQQFRLRCR